MVAVETLEKIASIDKPEICARLFQDMDLQTSEGAPGIEECTLLEIPAPGNAKLTARIFEGNPGDPHIIYFPAEYENLSTLLLLGQGFKKLGFTFASLDYRGTGLSTGKLSLSDIFKDADTFYAAVKTWMKDTGREGGLVIMGRSLGSAIALDLAERNEKELLCLIMESAFNLSRDFLLRKGIDENLVPEGPVFENRKKMSGFTKPVLFIHSPRDQIQTLSEVEWLVVESRSKATQFQIAPSGTREDLATQVGDIYLEFVHQYVNLRRGVRPKLRKHLRKGFKKTQKNR